MKTETRIRWSRRVPRHKIRRLYESDARGMLDEELLEDVGWGMYVRCQDLGYGSPDIDDRQPPHWREA